MAVKRIQATPNLVIELYPSDGETERPLLALTNTGTPDQTVVIVLDEVRHVAAALVEAAVRLAEMEVRR